MTTPEAAVRRAFLSLLLPGPGRLLAAVSGGPDSMALLTALCDVAPEFGAEIAVCHVNHGWRGAESRRDADFVEKYCRKRAIPFLLREGKISTRGRSREEAAREVRYRLLAEAAASIGAVGIVTAHNQDDSAETLLLALLRGRPLSGLSGIRERRDDSVFRPFLAVSRKTILAYLAARRIPFRRDSSNRDLSLDRNWVRRKLLPRLEARFGPAVSPSLAASAEALSRDREWMEAAFRREVAPWIRRDGRTARISDRNLRDLPAAVLRRVLLAMAAHAGNGFAPTRKELFALEKLASAPENFRFQAGRRVDFRRRNGALSAVPALRPDVE
jgi:tRNA(Ile)-lysidine synthase